MNIDNIVQEISSFLLRQDINNQHVQTISSIHLHSIYFRILNTVKTKRLLGLANDISFLIGIKKVKIEISEIANVIIVEVPRTDKELLLFKNVIKNDAFKNNTEELKFVLGEDLFGNIIVKSLAELTHLLIAGQTGAGKSVFLNSLICSIIQNKNVDLIMVDTKKVELSVYKDLKNLLFPLCVDGEQTISALSWVVNEMNKRYDLFEKYGVRNIKEYNNLPKITKMNRIVVIIDELADLMFVSSKQVETLICRIAQLSRASGIHLVVATQRPSHEVLTGLIKANLPTKIAFAVGSKVNSRVIIDQNGAEQLLGNGDMLFVDTSIKEPKRLQGVYISNEEIQKIVEKANNKMVQRIKKQDILIENIIEYISNKQEKEITSAELEEVFKIPEKKASEIMTTLEKQNYVGEYNLYSPRKILV